MQEIIHAVVEGVIPLTDTVLQIVLKPENYVDYMPGQYLKILCGNEPMCYSIANAPLGSQKYELHIRHSRDNPPNQLLLNEIKTKGMLRLDIPYGDCSLEKLKSNKPIVFIAGGTGFAPVKAMIEQLLADSDTRHFTLFWTAKKQSDLYMDNMVLLWQSHVKQCRYYPVLSSQQEKSLAKKLDLVLTEETIKNSQWVIAGPFDMAYGLRDILIASGASEADIYSDAFSFIK